MTEHDTFTYIACLAIVLAVAASARCLSSLTKIPLVLFELLGGIFIGPTVLDLFAEPSPFALSQTAGQALDGVVQIGGILLLFVIGMELNLKQIIAQRNVVLSVSFMGFAIPFLLGMGAVKFFPSFWSGSLVGGELNQAVLIGAMLSITALPVIARLLSGLNLLKTQIGSTIIGAAVIDDLIGWTLFAAISFSQAGAIDAAPLRIAFAVIGLVALCVAIGHGLGGMLNARIGAASNADGSVLGAMLVLAFVLAAVVVHIGFHAIFGAFLAGLVLSTIKTEAKTALNTMVFSFFSPVYFIAVGLKLNFLAFFDWKLVFFVTLIATVGKVSGAFLGARICGVPVRKSIFIGFGMNVRGAVGIVMATAAFQAGMVDERTYVALISMAVLTTFIGGIGLKVMNADTSGAPAPHAQTT